MVSKEGTIYLVPFNYSLLISKKLIMLNDKLSELTRNRKLYEKLVLDNEYDVIPNKILQGIKDKSKEFYNKHDIYNMFRTTKLLSNSNNVANAETIVSNENNDGDRLILTYYEKFKRYVIKERFILDKIVLYNKLNLSENTLRYMFRNLFKFLSQYILQSMNGISLPHNILLKVVGKYNSDVFKKHKKVNIRINWNESNKTLKAIAENIQPAIYKSYTDGDLKWRQFVQAMKPFMYNKTSRPNAPKWLVHDTTDLNYWLVIMSRYSTLKGIQDYAIVPSNYIAPRVTSKLGIERKQSEFMKLVKKLSDIITTEYLGFRDKLAMLHKYDKDYCYKTYDIRRHGI